MDTEEEFTRVLESKLTYAIEEFEPSNKGFTLNFKKSDANYITMQIVHRSYQEQTRREDDSFGFALHITFTPNPSSNRYHEKFNKLDISQGFQQYYYEDIPCYVIDLGKDIRSAVNLTIILLKAVYGPIDYSDLKLELTDEVRVEEWGEILSLIKTS